MTAATPTGLAASLSILLAALASAGLLAHASLASEPCHTVQAGDTLSSISRRYRVPLAKLRQINARRLTRPLRVGSRLKVPGSKRRLAAAMAPRMRALRARPGNLRRENAAATHDRLTRMRDRGMVRRFTRSGHLVPIALETSTYYVTGVSAALRVARPWTRRFIEHLARAVHASFGIRLKITSLTRTEARQRAIGRTNGNAAPARGPARSTHLTGASVDISKAPFSALEIDWLRSALRRLTAARLVHAIEEFAEPHFHVLVRRAYGALAAPPRALRVAQDC